jgi:23S rRNA pseudouridine1911/1915/1917 synthase
MSVLPNNHPYNYHFVVSAETNPIRLDAYLVQQLPDYSRSFIQKLITEDYVTVNDKTAKSSTILKPTDVINVTVPPPEPPYTVKPTPEIKKSLKNLPINIIYEEPDFYIIDKPAGLLVHQASTKSDELTLVDWLVHHVPEIIKIGYPERPGIVHRLDKDTSGLMIIPRTQQAHNLFSDLFKNHKIKKTYLAVVKGHPDKEGTIDLPIGRDPLTRNKMTIGGIEPREAITHYKVLTYFENAALVEVFPVTGRTNQIRVHFKAIGHPLIGDQLYGTKSPLIKRHALHASMLAFDYKGKSYEFMSKLPKDFELLLSKLKKVAHY